MKTIYDLSPEDEALIKSIDEQIAKLCAMKVDIYARSNIKVIVHEDEIEDKSWLEKAIQKSIFLDDVKMLDTFSIAKLVFEDRENIKGAVYNGDI